ncbi:hypothetical protein PENTCL1PPCAC_8721 [Pristionchus entomophagus]|uniref:Protein kinase n=1 Tax=Pristionchus entomophagus TaxID=358040 RepID=A0AAV5ST49_9BILA|nr:hypothetical protein PENTCL1PPCAC_8721 [Pristionchus entomophagus]
MAYNVLKTTLIDSIGEFCRATMTDDGTIFYRRISPTVRLYVKSHGNEIDAKLPNECIFYGTHGNAFYIGINNEIHMASFIPQIGVVVTRVRRLLEDEHAFNGLGTRLRNGQRFVYQLCDDPASEEILVDVPDRVLEGMQLKCITRNKIVYMSKADNFFHLPSVLPSVRKFSKNVIVVQHSNPSCMIVGVDRFVYIATGTNILYVLDIEALKLLPPLRIDGEDKIGSIVGVVNGVITLRIRSANADESSLNRRYIKKAQLPTGYYHLSTEQVASRMKEIEIMLEGVHARKGELEKNQTTNAKDTVEDKHRNHEECGFEDYGNYDELTKYRERLYRNEKDRKNIEQDQHKRERAGREKKERERIYQIKKCALEKEKKEKEDEMRKREELAQLKRERIEQIKKDTLEKEKKEKDEEMRTREELAQIKRKSLELIKKYELEQEKKAMELFLEQQRRKMEQFEILKRAEKEREMNEKPRRAKRNVNEMAIFESEFLKKFEPRKILGQGAFGCVFEARNLTDKYQYAVKRIPLRGSDDAINDALKEVITLAPLSHEGIVGYKSSWVEKPPKGWQKKADSELLKKLGVGETFNYKDDCVFIYIQMELCKQSLDDWLLSNNTRDLNRAKSWFKQLVSAVAYLHHEKKIHRDLKPCNILFDKNDRIKICDLGLVTNRALRNGQEIDQKRTITGSPMYMAPEQKEGNYTSKVDIFSLGLILAELCVLMTVDKAYQVFENYREGRRNSFLRHLPEVDAFVSLLTKKNAAERPNCEQILKHTFLKEWAELEREREVEREVDQCAICMERSPTIAFRCGHRTCPACSQSINICHICRKPITDRIRLY